MRTFCHISDFGPSGLASIPVLTYLSNPLTLWAPTAAFIDDSRQQGYGFLTPSDMLTLIDDRHIQVLARHWWYEDANRRNRQARRFAPSAWDNEFDGPLRRWAVEDAPLPETERRVRLVEDEDGTEYARNLLESGNESAQRQVNEAAVLLEVGAIPSGVRDRALGLQTDEERLCLILQNLRNHSRAFELSAADRVALLSEELSQYASLADFSAARGSPGTADLTRLPEILDILTGITAPRHGADLIKLLKSQGRLDLSREANQLLLSDQPIDIAILLGIMKGMPDSAWKSALSSDTIFESIEDLALTPGGIITAYAGAKLELVPVFAFAIVAATEIIRLMRKVTAWRKPDYRGLKFPFMLAYGTEQPTYEQVRVLTSTLTSLGPRGLDWRDA